jgi:hypothetical protein
VNLFGHVIEVSNFARFRCTLQVYDVGGKKCETSIQTEISSLSFRTCQCQNQ